MSACLGQRVTNPDDTIGNDTFGRRGVLALVAFLVLISACAKRPTPLPKPKPTPPPPAVEPLKIPSLPEATTPRREASQQIVVQGQNYLEGEQWDKALQVFQEAINIDVDNGVAYFYLAKTLYHMQLFEDAFGVLERADVLLGSDEEWRKAVDQLRALIQHDQAATQERTLLEEVY